MSSRKEQKEEARRERERREAQERAEAARRRRAQIIAGGVATVVLVAVIVAIASAGGGSSTKKDPGPSVSLPVAAQRAGCKLISEPSEGQNHVSGPFHYKLNPPATGNHDPTPASDGEYTSPPGIGHLVHALEHGRVILWYKPGAPANVVDGVRTVFNATRGIEIMTPNPTGMPYQVAASAWFGDRTVANPPAEVGHVLACPTWNAQVPTALRAFIAQWKGKGPERQFANVPE